MRPTGPLGRLAANRSARAAACLLAPMTIVAIFAPLLSGDSSEPGGWSMPELERRLSPPSPDHPLGTDALGRDVLGRLVRGARVSMSVGLMATPIALLIALVVGSIAGYYGGWTDFILARLIEVVMSFPALFLVLALLGLDPPLLRRVPDIARVMLVVGLTGWTGMARYARAEFQRLVETEFFLAARASGAGSARIILRHGLPNALPPVLVSASFFVAYAVLLESALSFLGFGVQPPEPSWGSMLSEAQEFPGKAWWLAAFPGAALFLTVLGYNLLGEGVRESLDPRQQTPPA